MAAPASFKRLPPKVQRLLRLTGALMKVGIMPSPSRAAKMPAAKRQQSKPAGFMIKNHCTTVEAKDVVIDSRGGPLRIRLYKPQGWVEGGPGLLYIHGGGFVMGGLDGCDNICRHLADRAGVVIASVEYRLVPDFAFPALHEDCEDALNWFVTERPYGIDVKRIGIGGDSAGGSLTATLAIHLRDTQGVKVKHQLLIYPTVDATCKFPSWIECKGAGVDLEGGKQMYVHYSGEHVGNPLVGPLAVEDLSKLPPAHVVTSDFDVLRDEGIAYAERLLEAGIKTTHTHYMGTAHGFLSLPALYPNAEQAFDEIAAAIREGLAA